MPTYREVMLLAKGLFSGSALATGGVVLTAAGLTPIGWAAGGLGMAVLGASALKTRHIKKRDARILQTLEEIGDEKAELFKELEVDEEYAIAVFLRGGQLTFAITDHKDQQEKLRLYNQGKLMLRYEIEQIADGAVVVYLGF